MIQVYSDKIWDLISKDVEIKNLASGFQFTEGPIWHPHNHHLLFSDVPGDVRLQYTLDEKVKEVQKPSRKCNGMTYDADLNLIVCEHLSSSLILEGSGGHREVIASHFEGKELNSPNDVCLHSDG